MNNPHPRLPEFEYIRLDTPESTTTFLNEHQGQAYPLSGGTDILVALRDGKFQPKYLVDLKHLDGFDSFGFDSNKLTIGAAITLNQIISSTIIQKSYPLLVQAAKQVGGYQLRNRATLVGNLCNASPCGDTIGPSILYFGELDVLGINGARSIPLTDFYLGPGKTTLQPDEIVRSINFSIPPEQHKGVYLSFGRNKLSDLALVAVTVLAYPNKRAISGFSFRIALSAVSPTIIIVQEAQTLLSEKSITPATLEQAAEIAKNQCKPIDDIRASKNYRRELVYTLTLRALQHVWDSVQL
jgi:aerobic carbon-monoxide dehydrogenase medium subunit